MSNILAVDLDGTLCEEQCWTIKEVKEATPIEENIKKTNILARSGYFVVIYTARLDELVPATLEWLRRHNVRYDAFCNKKMAASFYVDDKDSDFDSLIRRCSQ